MEGPESCLTMLMYVHIRKKIISIYSEIVMVIIFSNRVNIYFFSYVQIFSIFSY